MNQIILIFLLFGGALYIYITRGKRSRFVKFNILGVGVLCFYVIYSLFACLLVNHPDFKYSATSGNGIFSYEASVVLFCGLFICLLPLLKGNYAGFKKVIMCKELEYMFDILIICGIVELICYIPYAIHGYSLINLDIATVRDEGHELGGRVSSNFFISKFILVYDLFSLILPLGFFYYSIYSKKRIKAFLIMIVYTIIPFMKTITTGSRDNFVFPLITFIVSYLIFFPLISKKTKRIINITMGSFAGLIIFMSVIMSFTRFEDSKLDPKFHVIRYIGEGIVQFNCRMYDNIDVFCYGDFNFAYYRSLLGLDYSESNDIRRARWSTKLKYPTNVFYTHFGSYVNDFGLIGAFVFVSVIGVLLSAFTRRRGYVINFSQLIILLLVARIIFCGGFFFIDCSYFGGRRFFYFVVLCVLLRALENRRGYKSKVSR